jgi:hypothetical protein
MNGRRHFMKWAPALAVPAAAEAFSLSEGRGREDGSSILGAWNTIHTLPFPPGSFREFASFAAGGVFHETNSFLHTSSNLDFSAFGLPSAINAADGAGNWTDCGEGLVIVDFRKLLFDSTQVNFADFVARGTIRVKHEKLHAEWRIHIVDANTDSVLVDFGTATSEGKRLTSGL